MDNYEHLNGFVDIDGLNFRESYDTQSNVVYSLNYDDFFWVLGEKNGWYFGLYTVDENESDFGCASKKYITLIKYNYENSLETLVKESEYSKNKVNNSPNNTPLTTASEKKDDEQSEKHSTPKTTTQPKQKSYFTLGSTENEVKAVMGTPSDIIGDSWYYKYSSISFKNGKVSGWSNSSDNLKIN